MKLWMWVLGILIVLGVVMAPGWWYWTTNDLADKYSKRDLKCNSFGLSGRILGCDYRQDNSGTITEVVRFLKIVKNNEKVYVEIERNDAQKNVIHENVLIGKESDPVTPLAIFYLNFKIPTAQAVSLIGNPVTTKEFEKVFVKDKMSRREVMLNIISNPGQEPHIGSLYLYQP